MKPNPLVGTPAPKLTASGRLVTAGDAGVIVVAVIVGLLIVVPLPVFDVVLDAGEDAGGSPTVVKGLAPVVGAPVKIERPPVVVPPKPSCVPISCAKARVAATMRASISTCWDLRSNW